MRMTFRVSAQQRLIVVSEAVAQMSAFAQRSRWQAEAGGVLLGRHLLDSEDLVVDEVTVPQPADRRTRFSFFRSGEHQAVARRRWESERFTLAYLGLWHTHPEAVPSPSETDMQDWARAVELDSFEGERLFFPIAGTKEIRMWSMSRTGRIEELGREN